MSVMAFAGGVGVAQAYTLPVPPPVPPAIDPLLPLTPGTLIEPEDEGGQSAVQGDYGRFCENAWVHCR